MLTFCFNPSANRESLKEFNGRLQEYCLDFGAVEITAHAAGKYIVLNVTVGEELPLPEKIPGVEPEPIPTVSAAVLGLSSNDPDWEEQLELLRQRELDKATPEDPVREVREIRVIQNGFDPAKAWAIALVETGEYNDEEDEEGDSGDQGEGDGEGDDNDDGDDGQDGDQPISVGFMPGQEG